MNKELKWSQQYDVRLEEQEVRPSRPRPHEETRPPPRRSYLVRILLARSEETARPGL